MAYKFDIRGVYSFNVYPVNTLGAGFENVTVLGVMSYEIARSLADIQALHRDVYPSLPVGTPDRPEDFDYLYIQVGENKTVLGLPWINEETIKKKSSLRMDISIEGVSNTDVERVRQALVANGYNNISIRLNSVSV